jgi:hypothetical protein
MGGNNLRKIEKKLSQNGALSVYTPRDEKKGTTLPVLAGKIPRGFQLWSDGWSERR